MVLESLHAHDKDVGGHWITLSNASNGLEGVSVQGSGFGFKVPFTRTWMELVVIHDMTSRARFGGILKKSRASLM